MLIVRRTLRTALAVFLVTACGETTPPPVPTQLAITTAPPATSQNGVAFTPQPAIQVRDANGGNVGTAGVAVTAAIASGGGALGGTATVQTNTAGLAAFTNLAITGTIGARTLQFTATNLTTATSGSINLTAGPPTQLFLATAPSASVQNGVAFPQQPVVQLRDQSGNTVAQAGVAITAFIATGGGGLGGTSIVQTDASGQAVFTNLALLGTAGPRTLQFNAPGLTSTPATAMTVSAGPATQLVVATPAADTARSGIVLARQPAVQLRDGSANNVSQAGVTVVADIQSGGGTVTGTTSVQTNASGQAAFTDLVVTGEGTQTLRFTASGLATASSPVRLPTALTSGVGVGPLGFSVGNTQWYVIQVPANASQLTITTSGGTGDVDLYVRQGALPTISTFDCASESPTTAEQCGLANPPAGAYYVMLFAFATYSGVTLTATVTTSSLITVETQPADTARSGVAFARQPVTRLRDANNAFLLIAGVSVTASVASGPGSLTGTTAMLTDANGMIAWPDLTLTGAGTHMLQFAAPGYIPGTSAAIALPTPIGSSAPVGGLGGAAGGTHWYVYTVAAGDPMLSVATSGGTGDVNLYLRYNALPNTATFDCSGTGGTTTEQCDIALPAAGTWYVLVHGATAYSGVSVSVPTAGACTLATPGDADGDRLPDCTESNTGVYVGQLNTGTDPNDPDTDADNLPDGDEVLGTQMGLNLPAMGVSPLHKDILLEYDWFDDANECVAHSHRPTAALLTMVATAFDNSPVQNPDGSTGVTIINDYGQGGLFTGGNLIADLDGVVDQGVNGTDFINYKNANFAANRVGYFHYTLMPHRYNTNSGSSGQAELPGNDLIVSLYCANSDQNVANTIMHELGHNLLLRHGGFENTNWKPNYNSVMNYLFQFPGIDTDCTPSGDGLLSYSVGTRPSINESFVDETQGVCGTPPGPAWDWNSDGDATDVGYTRDINVDNTATGDGLFMVLLDYDDWANLYFGGLSDADGARVGPREIITCDHPELPPVRRR